MSERKHMNIGRGLPAAEAISELPDWKQAQPAWIEAALERALALPSGGWYVVDGKRAIGEGPARYRIAGEEYVVWRSEGSCIVWRREGSCIDWWWEGSRIDERHKGRRSARCFDTRATDVGLGTSRTVESRRKRKGNDSRRQIGRAHV